MASSLVILGFIKSRRYTSRAGKSSKPKTPLEGVRLNQEALEGVRLQVKSEEVGGDSQNEEWTQQTLRAL
jgi:hypothetical protein